MIGAAVPRRLAAIGWRMIPPAYGMLGYALRAPDDDRRATLIRRLAHTAETLGGAFHKAAQLLATRPDLFSEHERAVLGRLCDDARPTPNFDAPGYLDVALPAESRRLIAAVDPEPAACGSVAQVHHARLAGSGRRIVLKIRRPDVAMRFHADLTIMRAMARTANRAGRLATYPLTAAARELETAINGQLDFAAEARTQRFVRRTFAEWPQVRVPALIEDLCGDDVIAMELVESGRRIDSPLLPQEVRAGALRNALRCLYAMIFRHGVIHCDFHPGNLLVTPEGDLALLDFGYMAALPPRERGLLAELMLAVSFNDPHGAAMVVAEMGTPAAGPVLMDDLARDLDAIISRASAAATRQFQIARFTTALFEVQRKHAIHGDPGFTMAIMSLLALEGTLKTFAPGLDFQREAIGYLSEAVQR